MPTPVNIEALKPGCTVLYPGTSDVVRVSRVLLNDPDDPASMSPDPGSDPVVCCTTDSGFGRKFARARGTVIDVVAFAADEIQENAMFTQPHDSLTKVSYGPTIYGHVYWGGPISPDFDSTPPADPLNLAASGIILAADTSTTPVAE